jgi:signal transduction histidine kinase
MNNTNNNDESTIRWRIHPRVFAALGADLVTNDVIAVIEIVKNSYDAFAKNAWIKLGLDDNNNRYLEIRDNGLGMTKYVIENVWSVVATPFKHDNPYAKLGRKKRRVSGEKGLGRLSVARLGSKVLILTKSKNEPCWQVTADWEEMYRSDDLSKCTIKCKEYKGSDFPFKTGTIIRISDLKSEWNSDMIENLQNNLSRLISPFSKKDDFNIVIEDHRGALIDTKRVDSPSFFAYPKYKLEGKFNSNRELTCVYNFNAPDQSASRKDIKSTYTIEQICGSNHLSEMEKDKILSETITCGEFSFEVRVWDIGESDIADISENYDIKKNLVRRAIRAHKGLSVYRDDILVIPKSEGTRDWLGLDLRRVSLLGKRLSTSQIVGHVSITAEKNSKIVDKSDREGLTANIEEKLFEVVLTTAIEVLENERDKDRITSKKEKPLENLFEQLSAEELLAEVISIAEEGGTANDTVPLLKAFNKSLDQVRKTIQERFIYYSRLATVGAIAQMVIHEIRNRTTIFGAGLNIVREYYNPLPDKIAESLDDAERAIDALESLSEAFAPLASRTFDRGKRNSNLKERIEGCLKLYKKDIDRMHISTSVSDSTNIMIHVDPGEIDSILINLISNSVYWLSQVNENSRSLEFNAYKIMDDTRIRLAVDDSGPGIPEEDLEKVMWPGVTRKPGGIGMGLTVAAELVAQYGGQMSIKHPGTIGGASFLFDLPIKK